MEKISTIDDKEARKRLAELPGWTLEEGALRRRFTFDGFPAALAFLVRLGFDAEAADHHPDITVNYKRVTLGYVTHSAKGLTEKDFAGAAGASETARRMGGA